jgi:16S rRNA (adenine1518-N6/adenine1519-N6)-dimethyltransferase
VSTSTALPSIQAIVAQFGLAAKKSLGQHFLFDADWLQKIVRASGDLSGIHAIEIGPGPGGLTRALLASGVADVVAIEKDSRCIAALVGLQEHAQGRLRIIEADALAASIVEITPAPRAIIANLPYNVGTQLVINWLRDLLLVGPDAWQIMTVMLQKEVAQRMVAQIGSKAYGRLSVLMHWLADADIAFEVPPSAFHPPPKVTSAVLVARPLPIPRYPAQLELLEKVVAAAFNQRRKMLRSSLKSLNVDVEQLCSKAGVDATLRAEACSTEQFCALARAFAELA